ncbi:MAG TPA: response regulator [Dyella sp.]|uniref:hybrid sensor histidine kinase/response regulator n=1 Tax=Dyella sp. TaxID=1869338 RepID=UPI002B8E95FB|nr:response regulator [Dyella sp.]HTV86924.1 response regulator [Dyella sp.]
MSERVHSQTPTGQQDIAELQRHQHRLLYGGGTILSLLMLMVLLAWVVLSINDYRSDQLDDFRRAKLALDSAFIQRDAGYVRTLNMIEYVWRNKSAELEAMGKAHYPGFAAHADQAVVQASPEAMQWLVLGSDLSAWPQDRVERYLGLVQELSVISGTSIVERGKEPGTLGYFYDPGEALFAFGSGLTATQLHAAAEQSDRAALFSKLKSPDIDFNDLQALHDLRRGNPTLPFFGTGLPQVVSSFGKNPSTGQPSIVGSLVAMDGDTPIGAFVIYEPLERFLNQLRKAAQNALTVVAPDGQVVLSTAPPGESRAVAAAVQPWLESQPEGTATAYYRTHGQFFIGERIAGTPWTLVRAYTWIDVLRYESMPILAAVIVAAVLLALLWFLLIHQDRSVFAPALVRAKRVYQSELLNRTMIETSPVGLCVLAMDTAAPLLQNDLVRGYAADIPDPETTFYRQLLQGYGEAVQQLEGRPEAREFGLILANDQGEGRRHLLIAAMPIVYQDHRALFCVLRDVTARAELEENLRRARQDSETARLAAESASRAKSSFVAMMSHEIRTPLNGILGHLELMARSRLEAFQRERLDRIRISADTLLAIISDVLDFSRIEAGQLDIDPTPFELRPLMEQTALLYAPAAQRKGVRLYYGVDASLAGTYVADVHRIGQVLNNLVSNAVKFTESGRIVMRVRHAPETPGGTTRLRFEVIDSGIGMTEEQRALIFQPFSQADASISRRFGGSGLGLALCRQISELMGGSIEVQSTPAVGSVFTFDVPVMEHDDASGAERGPLLGRTIALLSATVEWRTEVEALLAGWGAHVTVAGQPSELDSDSVASVDALVIFGAWREWSDDEEQALVKRARRVVRATIDGPLLAQLQDGAWFVSCYSSAALQAAISEAEPGHAQRPGVAARDEQAEPPAKQRARVLLADDNPVNRELIQQQLEALGYGVDTAEDGTVALQLWQDGRYGIVLTDINMPQMNGYELTQELRKRGARVPIIAVTATALASEKVHCKDAGIDDLLLKPLSLERLEEALNRHLANAGRPAAAPLKAAWAAKFPEKVRRVFVESGTRDLHTILEAEQAGDKETLLARAHSLKGALLMLGEQDVAAKCAALEKRIDASDIASASGMLRDFERQMRALLDRYAQAD